MLVYIITTQLLNYTFAYGMNCRFNIKFIKVEFCQTSKNFEFELNSLILYFKISRYYHYFSTPYFSGVKPPIAHLPSRLTSYPPL